jgi:hypothetical protein
MAKIVIATIAFIVVCLPKTNTRTIRRLSFGSCNLLEYSRKIELIGATPALMGWADLARLLLWESG